MDRDLYDVLRKLRLLRFLDCLVLRCREHLEDFGFVVLLVALNVAVKLVVGKDLFSLAVDVLALDRDAILGAKLVVAIASTCASAGLKWK
jgi:hypothetical protein